ncbi:MAG: hypothetical protein LBF81_05355 [Prevotellaceae bacterium]|nr:hypothetical protein [Prevotellaceae bacterium]
MKRIEIADLWSAIDGGKPVLLHYFPQAAVGFAGRKNFRMRPDDRQPSANVFLENKEGGKFWYIQDKGGGDNKARNAVTLVMENENLSYPDAIRWIAERFAPQLLSGASGTLKSTRQPHITKSPEALNEIQLGRREGDNFTDEELKTLGFEITQDHCREMNLVPLDYYITRKNEKGESWMIAATPDYPMYYFDHGEFGKIYQPYGELRFMYVGKKPENYLFADAITSRLLASAKAGNFPEVEPSLQLDERIERLVICSGPSDALNVSANSKCHVCWANSETADIDSYTFYLLKKIAKEIYILYDLDDTGRQNALRIALKYLDLNIIWLPDDLRNFRDRKGKPCKDAKDFFLHYRTPKHRNPKKYFETLLKTAQSLKFWTEKYDKGGKATGYDIDNEQLYGFLQANGIYKIETNINKKGFTFCHVCDNIVTRIDEDNFPPFVNTFLINYLKNNPEYYSKSLINSVHRSNQVKLASLEKIKFGRFDFKSYDRNFDFFFFKNTAVRITKDGIFPFKAADVGKFVYDFNIIDHEFTLLDPPFNVSYSDEYLSLQNKLAAAAPRSPEWEQVKKQIDGFSNLKKYALYLYDTDFSFMKYVYNTCRIYWEKEAAGYQLTASEKAEHDLCFIAKVCALGYLLFRYKELGQAYYVYAMEMEEGAEGEHKGGTGKTILLNAIEYCRKQFFVDGQKPEFQKSEHLFSGVERGVTETVFFDDLSKDVDLHRFLNTITGKMEVRALYRNTEVIPFEEAPKVCGASNHGIRNFDASLRRRTWFAAFSSYYHPENRLKNLPEMSPFTEFGKNLISDYTPAEMNQFYNFMACCLHTYLKFRRRIQPPMESIERRNLQRIITDDFLWWADDWFNSRRLNVNIVKEEAFDAFKTKQSKRVADSIKMKTFTDRLQLWCQYHNYEYNPAELLKTETERKRNDIREYRNGEDVYCFHIRTGVAPAAPAPPENKFLNKPSDGIMPGDLPY